MQLPLEYRRPTDIESKMLQSTTKNVSTGGVYFETTDESLEMGDNLAFELGIPEGDNRFPKNGTISTIGEIVRLAPISNESENQSPTITRYGVAAQFQRGFKLEF